MSLPWRNAKKEHSPCIRDAEGRFLGDMLTDGLRDLVVTSVNQRVTNNRLAEAFIRGMEAGAEEPELCGDGDAMYKRFKKWLEEGKREST